MENLQVSRKSKKVKRLGDLVFAFPGMGKTPYALTHAGVVDADFGDFRAAMNVAKDHEKVLLLPWSKLISTWLYRGFTVLSNDPKLFSFFKSYPRAVVFLPALPAYSAKKMNVSADTVKEWTLDWEKQAKKYGLPVKWLSVGLDKYLS